MEKHVKRIADELTKIRKLLEKQNNNVDVREIKSMIEASRK